MRVLCVLSHSAENQGFIVSGTTLETPKFYQRSLSNTIITSSNIGMIINEGPQVFLTINSGLQFFNKSVLFYDNLIQAAYCYK